VFSWEHFVLADLVGGLLSNRFVVGKAPSGFWVRFGLWFRLPLLNHRKNQLFSFKSLLTVFSCCSLVFKGLET
jgi:hypothetical protein